MNADERGFIFRFYYFSVLLNLWFDSRLKINKKAAKVLTFAAFSRFSAVGF
jgi:hypothetical protein